MMTHAATAFACNAGADQALATSAPHLGANWVPELQPKATKPETIARAPDLVLPTDVADRIDQIVPPGIHLNQTDACWASPVIDAVARRRSA